MGTAPIALVRGSSAFRDDLVPHPWVGVIELPRVPVFRGPMASADTATSAAAIAVASRGDAPGDVLGEEAEIDWALAFLFSASWPTPAVVDDTYQRFPWDLGGSLVEQRYAALEGRRMVYLWTTIRANYGPLYAVPEGTATDSPFLRRPDDWRVCRVLRHLAERDFPPEVGDTPHFSWDYYRVLPPSWGRMTVVTSFRAPWWSGQSAPPWATSCSMSRERGARFPYLGVRPCTRSPPFGGLRWRFRAAWPRGCPIWWRCVAAS